MKKQRSIAEKVFGLYRAAVWALFVPILVLLLFFAAFSTCYMVTDWTEKTFFVKDSVWWNLGGLTAVVLTMTALKRAPGFQAYLMRIEKEEALFRKWRKIFLGAIMGMALVWVLASRCGTQGDQEFIQNAVYDLNTKNYLMFSEGGYLYRFAQQRGLTAVLYLFSLLFGSYNAVAFQVFNVMGIGLFYDQMSRLCGYFGMGRVIRLKVLLYGILFFPLIMYCSFVYGNIWGMALAMTALKFEVSFFEDKKVRSAVMAALLITLTLLLKSNYLIFLIGMVILAVLETVRKREVKFLLLPALAVVLWMGQGRVVNGIFEEVSGVSFGQEASKWSWIAMGLQEGSRAPGWYNDFVWYTYDQSGYDTEVHDALVKEGIRESLEYFAGHKWEAAEFFVKKMASQWNNPTFQAFWVAQVVPGESVRSNWVWHFISAEGAHQSTRFLNIFQFVVLAGALLYCILCRKTPYYVDTLTLAMIFVGGTLCHMIWEAKGQYVLTYFVLLFPYAAAGYHRLTDCLATAGYHRLTDCLAAGGSRRAVAPAVVISIILLAGIGLLCAGGCYAWLTEDTAAYQQYLQEMDTAPELEEGIYYIRTKKGLVLSHRGDESGSPLLCPQEEAGREDRIQVVSFQDFTWLYFVENSCYLSGSETVVPEGWAVTAQPSERREEERWRIRGAGDGGFFIIYNTYFALTYNEETSSVHLEFLSEENENQIWYREAVK